MSYTIHRTEAYILKSISHGEANRRIDLLTKELGLIRGTAQGVRLLQSKLRYSLTEFALVDIALVRGKDTWRIVNAAKKRDIFFDLSNQYQLIFIRVFSLINRLITGEFAEPHIFDLVKSAHTFLLHTPDLISEELFGLESVLILQLLHYLGYVGDGSFLDRYRGADWTREMLQEANIGRREMIGIINQALTHTGL